MHSVHGLGSVLVSLLGIAIICVYTSMGGLWAVMVTDMIQVALVTIGVVVLLPLALPLVGGWDAFIAAVPAERTHVFPQVADGHVWLAWLACWAVVGIGSVVSPDLMQRAFAAKTAAVARNSAIVAALIKTVLSIIMILLALVGLVMTDTGIIPESMLKGDMELIVPVMVKEFLPLPLMILFIGASLSAVMGAASSALLAMSGMMSKNIIKDFVKPDIDDKQLLFLSRICVIIFSGMALYAALNLKYVFLLVAFGFDLIMSSLFACMTLGMYWKKTNGYGAVAGIISGLLIRIIPAGIANGFTLEGVCSSAPGWYIYTLLGPIVAFAVTITVSLATQKANPSNEYGFHYDADDNPDDPRPNKGKGRGSLIRQTLRPE
jgi:Na+/proline symporter